METNILETEEAIKDINYSGMFENLIEVVDACPNRSLSLDYSPVNHHTFEDCPAGKLCAEDLQLINELLRFQGKQLDMEDPIALSAVVCRDGWDKCLTLTLYNGVLNSYQFILEDFELKASIAKEWKSQQREDCDVSSEVSSSDYNLLIVFQDVLLRDIRNRNL